MKIAFASGHASALAPIGQAGAGRRNVHVAELSAAMAGSGHQVTVYTRHGYTVVRISAGPLQPLPENEALCYVGDFARCLDEYFPRRPARRRSWPIPDLGHRHPTRRIRRANAWIEEEQLERNAR